MTIVVKGKKFETVREAARHFGINENTVYSRLSKGVSTERAFSKERIVSNKRYKKQSFRGVDFPSFAALCRAYEINRGTAKDRLRRGWTIEQILGFETPPVRARPSFQGHLLASSEVDGYIYLITCEQTQKSYVGLTTDDPSIRFAAHVELALSSNQVDELSLQAAIREFGESSFTMDVLETADTLAELADLERKAIKTLGTIAPHGYNLNSGGAIGGLYRKRVEIDGETFDSLNEACEFYEMSPKTVSTRLAIGWEIERALKIQPNESRSFGRKPIEFDGKKYKGRKELAGAYKLSPNVLISRLCNGWSLSDAVKTPVGEIRAESAENSRRAVSKEIRLEDKTYTSVAEAADTFELDVKNVYARLLSGWPKEEAFGIVARKEPPNAPKEICINDKTFPSIQKACEFFKISYARVKERCKRGWSIEKALVTPVKKLNKDCKVGNKSFKSLSEAVKHYGLNYSAVMQRIYNGWTIEEAFGIKSKRTRPAVNPVEFEGAKFPNLSELAREYGLRPGLISERLSYGWTLEQAVYGKKPVPR